MSSSLGEIRQIYDLLVKINQILINISAKQDEIIQKAPATKEAVGTAKEALRLFLRLMHLLDHLDLPREMSGALRQINKVLFAAQALYVSLKLLEAGTVYGQVTAAIGAMAGVFGLYGSVLEGY